MEEVRPRGIEWTMCPGTQGGDEKSSFSTSLNRKSLSVKWKTTLSFKYTSWKAGWHLETGMGLKDLGPLLLCYFGKVI